MSSCDIWTCVPKPGPTPTPPGPPLPGSSSTLILSLSLGLPGLIILMVLIYAIWKKKCRPVRDQTDENLEMRGFENQNFSLEEQPGSTPPHERTPIIGGPRAPNSRRQQHQQNREENSELNFQRKFTSTNFKKS